MNLSRVPRPLWAAPVALAGIVAALAVTPALAQGGGRQGGGRQGGFGGGGFGGGMRGGGQFGRQQRQLTILDVPVATILTPRLGLSADQAQKINTIVSDIQRQQTDLMASFRGGPNGQGGGQQPGQRPDFQAMRANMEKLQTARQEGIKNAEAVLNDTQKQSLPALLKEVQAFQSAGLPVELTPTLGLTADQTTRIIDIAQSGEKQIAQRAAAAQQQGDRRAIFEVMRGVRESTNKKVLEVLTAEQRTKVEDYLKSHPQPQWPGGGPGGPGGFGRGQRGGGGGARGGA
jgi:hypothetical protein